MFIRHVHSLMHAAKLWTVLNRERWNVLATKTVTCKRCLSTREGLSSKASIDTHTFSYLCMRHVFVGLASFKYPIMDPMWNFECPFQTKRWNESMSKLFNLGKHQLNGVLLWRTLCDFHQRNNHSQNLFRIVHRKVILNTFISSCEILKLNNFNRIFMCCCEELISFKFRLNAESVKQCNENVPFFEIECEISDKIWVDRGYQHSKFYAVETGVNEYGHWKQRKNGAKETKSNNK